MEGGKNRKRKMENAEDEENEEEKMEKFYELIKNIGHVRKLMQEKRGGRKPHGGVWNPGFKPEDFLDQDSAIVDQSKPKAKTTISDPHPNLPPAENAAGTSRTAVPGGDIPRVFEDQNMPTPEHTNEGERRTEGYGLDLKLSL